ncbi:MAG: hypothetical protein GY788_28740 [bacterium]|nr:hypothetical protein [bacterium]
MGIGGRVEVPTLWRAPSTTRQGRLTWPERSPFWDDHQSRDTEGRVLVSVFLQDRPGVLRGVTAALAEGIDIAILLAEDAEGSRTRFTIDGCLASSLAGAFIVAVVAHAVSDDGERLNDLRLDDLRRPLQSAVVDHLESEADFNKSELEGRVEVYPFESVEQSVFGGREFTEYRFSVAAANEDASVRLGQAAREFASELGRPGVPIAYMYFPDRWSQADDDQVMLRVGIGTDERVLEMLDLDLEAIQIAQRLGCQLSKYNPGLEAESFSERFREFVRELPTIPADPEAEKSTGYDLVFAEDTARSGYLAAIFTCIEPEALAGGTMSVLADHTISCWLVPEGQGETVRRKVVDLTALLREGRSGGSRVMVDPHPGQVPPEKADRSFWLAWLSNDQPGILHDLLHQIDQFLDRHGLASTEFDIKYTIARVLSDGTECAGKANFVLGPEALSKLSAHGGGVVGAFTEALGYRIGQERLVFRDSEPGEEPWAERLAKALSS